MVIKKFSRQIMPSSYFYKRRKGKRKQKLHCTFLFCVLSRSRHCNKTETNNNHKDMSDGNDKKEKKKKKEKKEKKGDVDRLS